MTKSTDNPFAAQHKAETKSVIDDVKVEWEKLSPEDRAVLADALKDWRISREEAGKLIPIAVRNWKTFAAIGTIIVAFVGSLYALLRPTPAPVVGDEAAIVKSITDVGDRQEAAAKVRHAETLLQIAAIAKLPNPTPPSPNPPDPGPKPDDANPVVLPAEVKAEVGRQVTIKAKANGRIEWAIPPGSPCDSFAVGDVLILTPKAAMDFPVGAYTSTKGEPSPVVWVMVKAGKGPMPPPDPGPKPEPPSPAPIPAAGFRVLIVYESMATLPMNQHGIIYGKSVRDYLNAKCDVGPDGKTKEWRIFDKDVDASSDSALWAAAMKRPRASVPWLIISNHPRGGYEGPLPDNVADTLTLLKKYGGE